MIFPPGNVSRGRFQNAGVDIATEDNTGILMRTTDRDHRLKPRMNTSQHEREALDPRTWDTRLARFCNLMIIVARSQAGRRLFRELMVDDGARDVKCEQQYRA